MRNVPEPRASSTRILSDPAVASVSPVFFQNPKFKIQDKFGILYFYASKPCPIGVLVCVLERQRSFLLLHTLPFGLV